MSVLVSNASVAAAEAMIDLSVEVVLYDASTFSESTTSAILGLSGSPIPEAIMDRLEREKPRRILVSYRQKLEANQHVNQQLQLGSEYVEIVTTINEQSDSREIVTLRLDYRSDDPSEMPRELKISTVAGVVRGQPFLIQGRIFENEVTAEGSTGTQRFLQIAIVKIE